MSSSLDSTEEAAAELGSTAGDELRPEQLSDGQRQLREEAEIRRKDIQVGYTRFVVLILLGVWLVLCVIGKGVRKDVHDIDDLTLSCLRNYINQIVFNSRSVVFQYQKYYNFKSRNQQSIFADLLSLPNQPYRWR